MQLFYNGLKERVKDELYKEDRPESIDAYMDKAIRIDDRQFQREQEKKGRTSAFVPLRSSNNSNNTKKKRTWGTHISGTTHSGPMEIDAAQTSQGKRDLLQVTCFNCGKKGHMKRDCRAPKQLKWKKAEATAVEGTRVIEIASAEYGQDNLEDAIDRAMDYDPVTSGDMSEGPDHSDPQQEGQEEGSHRAPTWEEIGRIAPIDRRLLTAVHVMNTFSGNQDIQAFVNPYQHSAPNNDATGHWTDPLEEYYRKSKENEKWDGFWKKRAVVIEGKSTKTWDESPREAEAYQPIERDTAQMHPLHFAHYRMPWFQCVTDGCHEHYGKNQDNRFWPTRRLDKQGEPKPVTCTYS